MTVWLAVWELCIAGSFSALHKGSWDIGKLFWGALRLSKQKKDMPKFLETNAVHKVSQHSLEPRHLFNSPFLFGGGSGYETKVNNEKLASEVWWYTECAG